MLTSKSFARPCAVLPYAMEKLRTFAFRRSDANISFTSAGLSDPVSSSSMSPYSNKHFPASMASRISLYMPIAVLEWKSPPASNASRMDTHPAMCASRRSSSWP